MDSATDRLGYVVRVIREVYRAAMEEALRPLQVTPAQFGVLSQIKAHPGLSAAQLARLSYVKPQSTHEVVGQLERAGLVRREPHPELGRVLRIHLTPSGSAMLKRCREQVDAIEAQTLAGLTPDERAQLLTLLTRVMKNLEQHRG